jgi:sterol 3beta-glucosyltransferase
MYVTTNHICFYSSVPPITDSTLKSSFLQKLTTRRPTRRYKTLWFVLKLDGLYIYEDPAKLYYPSTTIYLKNVATVVRSNGVKNGIKLTTSLKNYTFKADTELQANEWIDVINIAVFNSKNSGNDIKVVLPFQSISDISISKTEFNDDSLKITAVLDDPLGTEKYFFSYFNNVEKANETLNDLLLKSRKLFLSRPSTEKVRLFHSRKDEDRPPLEKSFLSNLTHKKSNSIFVPNSAPIDSNYLDIPYDPTEFDRAPFNYGHQKSISDCGGSSDGAMEQKNKIFKESFAVPEAESLLTSNWI